MLPLHVSCFLVFMVDQWQISSAIHPFDFVRNLVNFMFVSFFFLSEFQIFGTLLDHLSFFVSTILLLFIIIKFCL